MKLKFSEKKFEIFLNKKTIWYKRVKNSKISPTTLAAIDIGTATQISQILPKSSNSPIPKFFWPLQIF